MTDDAPALTGFGLPSDTGGKDLGIFLPIANGGWILSKNAPKLDGSYAYNRSVAKLADELGLDFVMSMAKYRGYGGATEHWRYALDSNALMAALAEATSRVKIWTTTHTLLQNPAVTAKMMATLDQISHGRAGLNVVTGAYKGEFAQMGAWPENVDHDERYALATEWIRAIKALWTQDSVTMAGKFFHLENCMSDPKPQTRPFLVCAGSSKVGMHFTSAEMDALFLSGADIPELAAASHEAKADAAGVGRAIRTYAMMTIVFGDTDAAAEAEAARYREGLDEGALHGMMRAYGFLDAEIGKENAFVQKARSTFMTPHVLGTPATVIDRLSEIFAQTSLDGLMLIFADYLTGMPIFGEQVLPALRQRFPSRLAAAFRVFPVQSVPARARAPARPPWPLYNVGGRAGERAGTDSTQVGKALMSDGTEALPHIDDLAGMITPARTALVVVDVQVDFAAASGVIGRQGFDMAGAEVAIDRIEELIAAARRAGGTVAFMRVMTRPETDSHAVNTWLARKGTPNDSAICRVGSGGEDYYRLRPEPGDIEIEKLHYDGFHNTDLDAQLRARGIDTLVITGITTDCCVAATASAAFHRDYHVFVVSDGCAAFGATVHRDALDILQSHYGLLVKSATAIAAWAA